MSEQKDFTEMARKREIEASKFSDEEIISHMTLKILKDEDLPMEMKFNLLMNSFNSLDFVFSNISQVYEEGIIDADEYLFLITEFSKLVQ
ncbi:MAG: hypothetical protein HeimC2_27740 [Candidatus Heimdallarchaeota archaeon LC_2]|nr:MAG: hypothetical protein HeimC2_27740 [Candidatus Heimdallarchaeota archaeon LC_2]